jgi:hypothetical protein
VEDNCDLSFSFSIFPKRDSYYDGCLLFLCYPLKKEFYLGVLSCWGSWLEPQILRKFIPNYSQDLELAVLENKNKIAVILHCNEKCHPNSPVVKIHEESWIALTECHCREDKFIFASPAGLFVQK